ncbi:hypothetical protein ABPG72_012131 [Tetrahymena utriculariae]
MEIEYQEKDDLNITFPIEIRYACAILAHIGRSTSDIQATLKEFDDVDISIRSVQRFNKQWREEQSLEIKYSKQKKSIDGVMNSDKHIDILKEFYNNCAHLLDVKTLFQQDYASCHVSHQTNQWFSDENIKLLHWPPHSPGLSPIQNIWPLIKQHIWTLQEHITIPEEIFYLAKKFFYTSKEIKEAMQNSYESLPKMIQLVIENQ